MFSKALLFLSPVLSLALFDAFQDDNLYSTQVSIQNLLLYFYSNIHLFHNQSNLEQSGSPFFQSQRSRFVLCINDLLWYCQLDRLEGGHLAWVHLHLNIYYALVLHNRWISSSQIWKRKEVRKLCSAFYFHLLL